MPIRLLHTADWHLGRTIRGRSRVEEFGAALDQVARIAVEERVDGLLLAGDIYDGRLSSPEADQLFFDLCLRLQEARIPILAIPGNHDDPGRFAAWSRVLAAIGVRVAPRVLPPNEGGVVELSARDGTRAAVACVPFVPERRFASAISLFEGSEAWYSSYAEGLGRLLAAMATGFDTTRVNVLLAHLFTDGALLGGGEREVTIGLDYAVSPARLPAEATYIALGHVHRPQAVAGSGAPARYAGSLLQLDFGEAAETKSVVLIEASPGRPARVREIPLGAGRRLVDVEGTLEELAAQAAEVSDAYVRAFVRTDGPVPGIADRVREILPTALDVKLVYERAGPPGFERPLSSLGPVDQFDDYYRSVHGANVPAELAGAFREMLAEATGT